MNVCWYFLVVLQVSLLRLIKYILSYLTFVRVVVSRKQWVSFMQRNRQKAMFTHQNVI